MCFCSFLSRTYLEEDGEVDDGDGGGDEHGLQLDVLGVDEEHQGEGHGAPQPAVRHDELLHAVQLVEAEGVHHGRQHDHTWRRQTGRPTDRQVHTIRNKQTKTRTNVNACTLSRSLSRLQCRGKFPSTRETLAPKNIKGFFLQGSTKTYLISCLSHLDF